MLFKKFNHSIAALFAVLVLSFSQFEIQAQPPAIRYWTTVKQGVELVKRGVQQYARNRYLSSQATVNVIKLYPTTAKPFISSQARNAFTLIGKVSHVHVNEKPFTLTNEEIINNGKLDSNVKAIVNTATKFCNSDAVINGTYTKRLEEEVQRSGQKNKIYAHFDQKSSCLTLEERVQHLNYNKLLIDRVIYTGGGGGGALLLSKCARKK